MAYSLEGRTPFLSHKIVEFAASMPCDLKLNLFNSKIILKKLAYNYIPRKILEKPKRGFGVPLDSWLRNELKEWSSERIYDKKNYENLPINRKKVIDLYECHLSGKRNVQPLLWAVLIFIRVQFKKIFNFMIDKKILILGSSGMIGSNLFKILFDKGYEVYGQINRNQIKNYFDKKYHKKIIDI